jgi:hypothetical protein
MKDSRSTVRELIITEPIPIGPYTWEGSHTFLEASLALFYARELYVEDYHHDRHFLDILPEKSLESLTVSVDEMKWVSLHLSPHTALIGM